jgi:polar amino acid transport system substrate-binding protein
LAVLAGGTEETLARRDGVPDAQLMRVGDQASGIAAVVSGRADGFALSAFAIFDIARTAGEMIGVEATPSITEVAGEVYKGHGAIAFPRGSNDAELTMHMAFRDAFNEILADYMDSGSYVEMASRWGFSEADGPVLTTQELCTEGL